MRTAQIVAFLLLAAAAVLAVIDGDKKWPVALIAAALAVELVPAVFQV